MGTDFDFTDDIAKTKRFDMKKVKKMIDKRGFLEKGFNENASG